MSAHGGFIFIWFVMMVIWIIVSMLVASDASEKGGSGAIWGITVFFFGLIGLLLYIAIGPSEGNA